MAGVWLNQFFRGIPVYLFTAGAIVMYFWKGYVLKSTFSRMGDNTELFYVKHKKITDLGAILLLLLVVVIYHLNVTIPLLRDYELLKDGYYEETEGIVVGGEFNDTTEAVRDIIIEKQDDEDRSRVTIYSTPIEKGEYVKVHYLPNSHVGEVIERSGNTDLEE